MAYKRRGVEQKTNAEAESPTCQDPAAQPLTCGAPGTKQFSQQLRQELRNPSSLGELLTAAWHHLVASSHYGIKGLLFNPLMPNPGFKCLIVCVLCLTVQRESCVQCLSILGLEVLNRDTYVDGSTELGIHTKQ